VVVTGDLLLDTHVLLWMLLEPARLPGALLARLRDRQTGLVVSAATGWEVATKHRLGRLSEAEAVVVGYSGHLQRLGTRELPITARHALTAGQLNWAHRDPFDRMLAAQSMTESLPVVTADRALSAFPGITTVW